MDGKYVFIKTLGTFLNHTTAFTTLHEQQADNSLNAVRQGRIQGGKLGRYPPLKPTKVTSFIMTVNNSENSIRDIRPFWRPLFCPESAMKYSIASIRLRRPEPTKGRVEPTTLRVTEVIEFSPLD